MMVLRKGGRAKDGTNVRRAQGNDFKNAALQKSTSRKISQGKGKDRKQREWIEAKRESGKNFRDWKPTR